MGITILPGGSTLTEQKVTGNGEAIISLPNCRDGQIRDIRLLGRTLYNYADNGVDYANWTIAGTGTTKGANGIHLVQNAGTENAQVPTNLKPNTQYTLVYNVKATTLIGSFSAVSTTGVESVFPATTSIPKTIGTNKVVFTTPATIVNNRLYFVCASDNTEGQYIDFELYSILEGDYTADAGVNQPLSYGVNSTLPVRLESLGKNLFDGEFVTNYGAGNSPLSVVFTEGRYGFVKRCKPNTTYTISRSAVGDSSYWICGYLTEYPSNGDELLNYKRNDSGLAMSTNSPDNAKYFYVSFGGGTSPNVQLEEGIQTEFEPYTESTSYISSPSGEPWRSVPNGTKDEVRDGKHYKRVSDEVIINGSLDWQFNLEKSTSWSIYANNFLDNVITNYAHNGNTVNSITNAKLVIDGREYTPNTSGLIEYQYQINTGTKRIYIELPKETFATTPTSTDIKNYFNSILATLIYQLAEEVVTDAEINIFELVNGYIMETKGKYYGNGTIMFEPTATVKGLVDGSNQLTLPGTNTLTEITSVMRKDDPVWTPLTEGYSLDTATRKVTITSPDTSKEYFVAVRIEPSESTNPGMELDVILEPSFSQNIQVIGG